MGNCTAQQLLRRARGDECKPTEPECRALSLCCTGLPQDGIWRREWGHTCRCSGQATGGLGKVEAGRLLRGLNCGGRAARRFSEGKGRAEQKAGRAPQRPRAAGVGHRSACWWHGAKQDREGRGCTHTTRHPPHRQEGRAGPGAVGPEAVSCGAGRVQPAEGAAPGYPGVQETRSARDVLGAQVRRARGCAGSSPGVYRAPKAEPSTGWSRARLQQLPHLAVRVPGGAGAAQRERRVPNSPWRSTAHSTAALAVPRQKEGSGRRPHHTNPPPSSAHSGLPHAAAPPLPRSRPRPRAGCGRSPRPSPPLPRPRFPPRAPPGCAGPRSAPAVAPGSARPRPRAPSFPLARPSRRRRQPRLPGAEDAAALPARPAR